MNFAMMPTSEKRDALAAFLAARLPVDLLRDATVLRDLAARWLERHRVWHGVDHLRALIARFEGESDADARATLLLAAAYHDAIFNPLRNDNEEVSAALLALEVRNPEHSIVRRASEIIMASRWQEAPARGDALAWKFWEADSQPLSTDYPLGGRLAYERSVFREYQYAPWPVYRERRAAFLASWARKFPAQKTGVEMSLELLRGLAPRVAVYPGSFHPFHLGHLSTLRQAERIFDKVVIGVAVNRQKPDAAATLDERCAELRGRLCFHEVAAIPGLLTRYLDEFDLQRSVVRGVRDGTDLEAELRYARFLEELRPGTNVVWIGCESELQHLSSSAIRELDSIENGAGGRYVPTTQEIYGLVG